MEKWFVLYAWSDTTAWPAIFYTAIGLGIGLWLALTEDDGNKTTGPLTSISGRPV